MRAENWLPVVGYEGLYDISDRGRVWSHITGIFLKPGFNPANGKVHVTLNRPRKIRYIHHLVLEAFVGPRPEGKEGCHFNDIGTNNWVGNLRWDTRSANKFDAVRNGIHQFSKRDACSWGHKYTEASTYHEHRNGSIRRKCRICRRERYAESVQHDRRRI